MTITIIFGDGPLGRAIETGLRERGRPDSGGNEVRRLGRPVDRRHRPVDLAGADVLIEASRPDAVIDNLVAGIDAGARRAVIATTGWQGDRRRVEAVLREAGIAAVAASNFSLGMALLGRLVDRAVELFGPIDDFDPFIVEWHRRSKRDRPSGTALDLAARIAEQHPRLAGPDELEVVSVRAGASPGMHLIGFDAPGETVELRLTARDRSAYVAGILASLDWLTGAPREPGLHSFDQVIDELLARQPIAA